MFTARHPQHDTCRVERPLGRGRRRVLARAAVLTLGAGVGALSLTGPAHADGIGVDVDGCGITITVGAPAACPTPASQPGVPLVDQIAPATVDVTVPVTLPDVAVNVDPGGGAAAAPAVPVAPAPPLVTAPPIVDDAAGAVGAELPIPVATATVTSPVADCVVDVAAVIAGAGCGVQATAPTGALPPVAAGAVDAVVDDTSGLIDPTLAGAGTDTGATVQLASISQVELTTCTGVAVLGPVPDPCPATTTPSNPTGDGGTGTGDGGSGDGGLGGSGAETSASGAGTAGDQLAASGVGPIATQVGAAEGDDATLPMTGLAIGGILLAGAGSLSAGLAARRMAHGRHTAR